MPETLHLARQTSPFHTIKDIEKDREPGAYEELDKKHVLPVILALTRSRFELFLLACAGSPVNEIDGVRSYPEVLEGHGPFPNSEH